MTKEEFQLLLQSVNARMVELTASKGEEYARSDDQLANFKRAAADAGVSPYAVWLVFFNKHIDSIKWFVQGKALSEPIESRIDDAILYLILLRALTIDSRAQLGMPRSYSPPACDCNTKDGCHASACAVAEWMRGGSK